MRSVIVRIREGRYCLYFREPVDEPCQLAAVLQQETGDAYDFFFEGEYIVGAAHGY